MSLDFSFFITALLLGAGLAMDAFSVSLANGLNEPSMSRGRMAMVAGVFAAFQFAMPLAGWACVCTLASCFALFERLIPVIALVLLCWIGGKMLLEGLRGGEEETRPAVGLAGLLVQGVATSIDALSVGFTISNYTTAEALLACLLIGAVTFVICCAGLAIGKTAGTRLAGRAGILGGVILIAIGIRIFIGG